MTYRVNYTDDTKSPIIVQDGDVDTSTNIGLVGRGYTGFGEVVAENFLHLLENFSDETPPARPVEGQLWYNNTNSSMYYYTVSETWKKIGNVRTESFDPILNDGEVNGDIWLNTSTSDLYIYSSPNWVLMANGDISTKVYTRTRKDTQGNAHKTIEVVVANKVVAVFSSDVTPWTPNSTGSDTETLDDGSVMADIYSSIKLGINLVNRKSITEVTVSTTNPTAGTTSQYVQEGDMWVNKTSNRLYTYTNSSWKRINNYVKVRAAVPVIENDEQSGDLWINTLNDKIYYYNPTTSSWEFLASNTTFSTISPTSTDIRNIGDYWINTEKLKLYAYDGSDWLDLTFQEKGTFVRSVVRKDINNVDHKVLENIVDGKTISVISSDTLAWKANTSELLYEGGSYAASFIQIFPGYNLPNFAGEIVITRTPGVIPDPSSGFNPIEFDIWKDYSLSVNYDNIKVRNASNAWQDPLSITVNSTRPTGKAKYSVWITQKPYRLRVYNGNGENDNNWVDPSNTYSSGITKTTTTGSPRVFNGIATKQTVSGSFINYYEDANFEVGSTYFNGLLDEDADSNTPPVQTTYVLDSSVRLYPKQWTPLVVGNISFNLEMIDVTAYSFRVVRIPMDSNGNELDAAIIKVAGYTNLGSPYNKNGMKYINLKFVDAIGGKLAAYYPTKSGPFLVRYGLLAKKTGTVFTISDRSIQLDVFYIGVESVYQSGGAVDDFYYYNPTLE